MLTASVFGVSRAKISAITVAILLLPTIALEGVHALRLCSYAKRSFYFSQYRSNAVQELAGLATSKPFPFEHCYTNLSLHCRWYLGHWVSFDDLGSSRTSCSLLLPFRLGVVFAILELPDPRLNIVIAIGMSMTFIISL